MALILGVYLGVYVYKWEFRKPLFEVYFFSLNRGRAIFIRTPENKTILIGGGQTSETIREITKVMPFYKREIDYLIIPSAVPAQIGGLVEIIDRYNIEEIFIPKLVATSTALDLVMKKIRKEKIHTENVERGDEIIVENNVKIKILFPYAEFKFNKTSLPEIGLSISYGSTTAYLLGNLSKTIQKDIYKNIEIEEGENVVEYYNSAIASKVFADLLQEIDPKFTFSTREKSMHLISDGEEWRKE